VGCSSSDPLGDKVAKGGLPRRVRPLGGRRCGDCWRQEPWLQRSELYAICYL